MPPRKANTPVTPRNKSLVPKRVLPPQKTNTPVTPRNKPLVPKRVLPRQGGLINDPLPDTLGPTPIKSGLSTTDGCVFLKDVVDPQLKEDINRNMQGLLDVKEFVKSVWGFDDADLNFNNWTYQPPTELHDMYKVPDEKARYTPFCDMLVDAFNQWRKAVGLVRKRTVKLVRNPDKTTIRGYTGWFGKQNERRPDVVGEGMAGLLGKEISTFAGVRIWNGMPIVGEFKRWYLAEIKRRAESGLPMSAPELYVPAMASSSGAKRRNEVTTDGPPFKRQKLGHNPQLLATVQDDDDDDDETPPGVDIFNLPAEAKLTRATNDQVQLAGYANEIFASVGNRRYVTGLFVRGNNVSLWYYDRIGVVKSKEFSIFDKADSKLFVLVAVAMSVCDRDHLGFEPLLHPPTDIVNPSTVKDNTLHLPAKHTVDGSGVQVHDDVSFQVLEDEAIYIQYGIIGRGTVVFSVAPKDTGGLELPKGELIAKLSWPVKSRVAEDVLIREIRSMIGPTWSKHIPELFCSTTLDGDALGLPRTLMPSLDDASEERVLRVLIAQRAEGLAKARSLEEFKAIFLHVVRCHRVVFVKANVLHRDLSVNNILFTRDDDKKPLGLLNDWDLGKRCKTDQTPETPSARHRTGTAPFMALDLLKDDPPQHLYRHDLESFIYILIFCAMHFNLNGTQEKRHPLLYGWTEGSWNDIYSAKDSCFSDMDNVNDLLDKVRPAFQPILDDWISPLCELFVRVRLQGKLRSTDRNSSKRRGVSIIRSPAQQAEEDAWNETRGGLMTFESFMTAIGEDPVILELADIPQ